MSYIEDLDSANRTYSSYREEIGFLKEERDALAAHVGMLESIINSSDLTDRPHVMSELNSLPETSLARLKAKWQAEVATRIFCDLEAEFDPCHPIIERVEHIESEYLSQAGGDE